MLGAEEEAHSIVASLFDHEHTLLIGVEATEAAVKGLALKHNIVHLATHGIAYTEDLLASFVAFSPTETENGLLTAREVASNRSLPADLVILSACQTGLSRVSGDGMLEYNHPRYWASFIVVGAEE